MTDKYNWQHFDHTAQPLTPLNDVHPGYLCISKLQQERPFFVSSNTRRAKLRLANGTIKEFDSLGQAGMYVGYKDHRSANTALITAARKATKAGWFWACGKKYKLILNDDSGLGYKLDKQGAI